MPKCIDPCEGRGMTDESPVWEWRNSPKSNGEERLFSKGELHRSGKNVGTLLHKEGMPQCKLNDNGLFNILYP
jgi:hypothetical protein